MKTNHAESGGVTILTTLFLLVLLTITAMAMSKNSLREVMISGTSRQAADVRNLADGGLEWSIYWMADDQSGARPQPGSGTAAYALRALKSEIIANPSLQGVPRTLATSQEMVVSTTDFNRSFNLAVTDMGPLELEVTGKSPTANMGVPSASALQLWAVKSTGQASYSTLAFQHSREAWFTLLPSQKK